ncbi:MAG TPA: nitrate/nitrite transporter [Isosphaeraceae bacterium]|nr:nitrate/nitrite transporter [Isosphaeraceae bacterium]
MKPDTARWRVLVLSTVAFTLLFNVWLMLGVLGIKVRQEFHFSPAQMEWLAAAAILAGALPRLNFGIWADRYGGRTMTLVLLFLCAVPAYLVCFATTYMQFLACALLFGLAGTHFTVGISWNSAWFPNEVKGTALGIFGAGNIGASGTKLLVGLAPSVLTLIPTAGYLGGWIPGGWRALPAAYAAILVLMGVAVFFLAPTPDRTPGRGRTFADLMRPLRDTRVWRFSLYYVVVFGAYVALSAWLPTYYHDTYGVSLRTAALLTATYIFPASLLRPVGGWLSDRFGPRVVTYAVFVTMALALAALSVPRGTHLGIDYEPGLAVFAGLMFVVGAAMGIGKASVYKYVPDYYPDDVGAVGGLVGALGAMGGFLMPPAFGAVGRVTGAPQAAFLVLLVLTLGCLAWLHVVVLAIRARERAGRSSRGAGVAVEPA